MRSTLLLAALAAGAVDAFEKRVYVTDWTTVTVTKTVTAPAVTFTVPPVQQNQQPLSTSSAEVSSTTTAVPQVSQAAPQVSQPPTVAVADNTDNSDNSALAKKSPAPEAVPQEGATTYAWTSAWATTWGAEQPASTLETASSTASEQPAATPSTHYETTVLYNHNIHRSNHSAPSVGWNKQLEESARVLAAKCVYEHDTSINGGGYGQNIGYGTSAEDVGIMLTNEMYNDEIDIFPWSSYKTKPDMSRFKQWGHFSQMIWKSTKSVGCATVICPSLANAAGDSNTPFTVCNYSPAGNMDGEYLHNIAPGGSAAVYSA